MRIAHPITAVHSVAGKENKQLNTITYVAK